MSSAYEYLDPTSLGILRNAYRQQAHAGKYGTLEDMPPEALEILLRLAEEDKMGDGSLGTGGVPRTPPRGDGSLGAAMGARPPSSTRMGDGSLGAGLNTMRLERGLAGGTGAPAKPPVATPKVTPPSAPVPSPEAPSRVNYSAFEQPDKSSGINQSDLLTGIGAGLLSLSNRSNLQQLGQFGMKRLAEGKDKREAEAKSQAIASRTIQFLKDNKRLDLAEAVSIGALDPRDSVTMALKKAELPADVQKYMWLMQNPEAAKYLSGIGAIGGKGTNVNINSEGSIPAGYEVIRDAEGRPIRMQPIQGSPTETAAGNAAAGIVESGGIVIDNIDRLQEIVANDSILSPIFGVGGLAASYIPGTKRLDAQALADIIKSNIGFDQLTQMRKESPTGGALGQVTERELAFLQSVLTNLSFSQSQEQFQENLQNLRDIYADIIRKAAEYPNAEKYGIRLPASVSPEVEQDPLGLFD